MYATYTLKFGDSYRTIIINKFFINSIQCISKVARKIGKVSPYVPFGEQAVTICT